MTNSPHSETTTEGIRIHAAAEYLPQESLPQDFGADGDDRSHYVFRYKITMTNTGTSSARLLTRLHIFCRCPVVCQGGEVAGRHGVRQPRSSAP